eukprot:scaffold662667_cov50-Prasinocladus_malaysianus.AAC.4
MSAGPRAQTLESLTAEYCPHLSNKGVHRPVRQSLAPISGQGNLVRKGQQRLWLPQAFGSVS